ncbi:NUDIX domain-containing protein [Candidatus Finniella inopinata]|uniref:NUDIX domain-containing protein n=1 Tax=Candidatus Finniella inopinata TaxID=1696036 RepID=A0A4Q7DGH7_9PROT|nr:NUDIX domain-containing protein [Candidatus Finniella inopinata]RZI45913.1 NUDIX domain-containing protein [Candidatus Finniella inopinata]
MLGFLFIIFLFNVLFSGAQASAPIKVSSFQEIQSQLMKLPQAQADPAKQGSRIQILIDIDDIFLDGDKESNATKPVLLVGEAVGAAAGSATEKKFSQQQTSASLVDEKAIQYIYRWLSSGYQVAFLTSRNENERGTTVKELSKVGIQNMKNISLYMTDGKEKGEWLKDSNQTPILNGVTTLIYIDYHNDHLKYINDNVCKTGTPCYLFYFGNGVFPPNVYGFPENLERFTKQHTEAGGTRSTFILKEGDKPKFVLKVVAKDRVDQFKEEVLADAIYQAIGEKEPSFGVQAPKFQIRRDQGSLSRITEFLPGVELGFNQISDDQIADVAKGFIVDVFMANWDLVVSGKNFWVSNSKIYRMDNGGALRYRALGELKARSGYDFSTAVNDLYTLRGKQSPYKSSLEVSIYGQKFYGQLTETQILKQIIKLVALQDKILATADQYNAWLNIKDYVNLKSDLITRLESLKKYYYDQVQPVAQYEQAHPFAVVIPNKKSSASILIVVKDGEKNKVLLGKDANHAWWGNLGGEAEDKDKTLLKAAVREVREESMGLYHVLTDDLVKAPFHDLIKGGDQPDALHRMYLLEGRDYIDPAIFKKTLDKQTARQSREYDDFTWVDVAELLALVKSVQSTPNQVGNKNQYFLTDEKGKKIAIHHPLMDMLRQVPVVAWLEALAGNGKVGPTHTQGSIGSKVIEKAQGSAAGSSTSANASSSSASSKEKDPRHPYSYPYPPFFDPRAEEEERLYYLMNKHLALMTQVKQKGEKIQKTLKRTGLSTTSANASSSSASSKEEEAQGAEAGSSTSAVGLSRTETATDMHLRWSLEKAKQIYTPGNDQQNIYLFLKDVSPLSKGYCEEFNAASGTCAPGTTSYKCMLLEAMAQERKMKNWFVFYHTMEDKMAFIYDMITELRKILKVDDTSSDTNSSISYLRAFNTFFKGVPNVEAFIADQLQKQQKDFQSLNNYDANYAESGLSTNIYLFGNPNEGSSSTFNLVHENTSLSPPKYQELLLHVLIQFGIMDTKKYFDLFETYFGNNTQGQLLQIFINPEIVDDVVYLAATMGKGLYPSFAEQKEKLSPRTFLTELRNNINAAQRLPSTITLDTLQARIFLKPEIMKNPDKVKIVRYFKVPPKEGYLKALRAMIKDDIMQWLSEHNKLPSSTLESSSSAPSLAHSSSSQIPPIQKAYVNFMFKGTGKVYETRTAASMYGQFLKADDLDGIKQILAQDPNFDLFKPIANTAYQNSMDKSQIYPVKLLSQARKISAMILGKYANQVQSHIENAMKGNAEEKEAYLIWCRLLVEISDRLDKQAEALAAASITEALNRENALKLFDMLIAKKRSTEAKKVVMEIIVSKDSIIRAKALTLFKALIENHQIDPQNNDKDLFERVKKTAIKGIESYDAERDAAYSLFEALISNGLFDAATQAATVAMEMSQINASNFAFNLTDVFIRNNQFNIAVQILATGIKQGYNYDVKNKACHLLEGLVRSGKSITKDQFIPAAKEAKEVINNQDYPLMDNANKLLEALAEKGMS